MRQHIIIIIPLGLFEQAIMLKTIICWFLVKMNGSFYEKKLMLFAFTPLSMTGQSVPSWCLIFVVSMV